MPTSYLVYSSFSAFADHGNDEIPGTWFIKAFEQLKHSNSSVRQTLYRMVQEKELTARKVGKTKFYSMSAYGRAEIGTGIDKIFLDSKKEWDGLWTLVQYTFPESQRIDRDRLRTLLETMGFAALGNGLFVHPRADNQRIQNTLNTMGVTGHVRIFSASPFGKDSAIKMVRENWDLDNLQKEYSSFVKKYSKLKISKRKIPDELAFKIRYAIVIDFLKVGWRGSGIPNELLPKNWQGNKASELAAFLYKKYIHGAQRHADTFGFKANQSSSKK